MRAAIARSQEADFSLSLLADSQHDGFNAPELLLFTICRALLRQKSRSRPAAFASCLLLLRRYAFRFYGCRLLHSASFSATRLTFNSLMVSLLSTTPETFPRHDAGLGFCQYADNSPARRFITIPRSPSVCGAGILGMLPAPASII